MSFESGTYLALFELISDIERLIDIKLSKPSHLTLDFIEL